MRVYLLKRAAMTVLVLLLVTIFISLLTHIVPGDAARTLLGPLAKPELVEKFRVRMGLDQPVPVQVARFVWNVLHGSFGTDAITGREIGNLIAGDLPHTLILAWTSLGLAVLVGLPLGVYSATHPDSWLDRLTALISISFITVPSYVAGLFLLLLFAVQLKVMPAIGVGERGDVGDYIRHLILPAVALAVTWIGYLARLVRASLLEVLGQDYLTTARAKGLSERSILWRHALRNSLLPVVTVAGLQFGFLLGGTVVAETVFARQGLGRVAVDAILYKDLPVVQGIVLTVAVVYMAVNLLVDIAYALLDPRIRWS